MDIIVTVLNNKSKIEKILSQFPDYKICYQEEKNNRGIYLFQKNNIAISDKSKIENITTNYNYEHDYERYKEEKNNIAINDESEIENIQYSYDKFVRNYISLLAFVTLKSIERNKNDPEKVKRYIKYFDDGIRNVINGKMIKYKILEEDKFYGFLVYYQI